MINEDTIVPVSWQQLPLPIEAQTLHELCKPVGCHETVRILTVLENNILTIHFNEAKVLLNDKKNWPLFDRLLTKTVDFTNAVLVELIKSMSEEKALEFFNAFNHIFDRVKDFDPKTLVTHFKLRKTIRNNFLRLFDLPEEPIEDRGCGIEIFGEFVRFDSMVSGENRTFNHKDGSYKVHLFKSDKNKYELKYDINSNAHGMLTRYYSQQPLEDKVYILDYNGCRLE